MFAGERGCVEEPVRDQDCAARDGEPGAAHRAGGAAGSRDVRQQHALPANHKPRQD